MALSIESTLANLYGMYPLGSGQKMIPVDAKYHVPPFNQSKDHDGLFALPEGQLVAPMSYSSSILLEDCPNEFKEMEKNILQQKYDYDEMNMTYTPFFRRMATAFNMSGSADLKTIAKLAETVRVDRFLGRKLPG